MVMVTQSSKWSSLWWSHYLKKSQGTTTFADIVDDHSDSSSEDDEEEESDEDGGIEEVEEEGDVNWLYILFELYFFPNKTVPSWCFLLSLLLSFWSSAEVSGVSLTLSQVFPGPDFLLLTMEL